MRWNEKIYALYKGDEYITDGSIPEISQMTGKTIKSLRFMTYPSYEKRLGIEPNRLMLVLLEDEES